MSKPKNTPLERLKHHVTGAIERGEGTAIEAVVTPKHTLSLDNVYKRVDALKRELEEQRVATNAPGNPYISALGGKIAGAEEILSIPIVKAAPEMLEAIEYAISKMKIQEETRGCSKGLIIARQNLEQALAKARGES